MTEEYRTLDDWIASRPQSIQALIRLFPNGAVYLVEGVPHHLIGYSEADDGDHKLILTPVDPTKDYDAAVEAKIFLCARYFKGRMVDSAVLRAIVEEHAPGSTEEP